LYSANFTQLCGLSLGATAPRKLLVGDLKLCKHILAELAKKSLKLRESGSSGREYKNVCSDASAGTLAAAASCTTLQTCEARIEVFHRQRTVAEGASVFYWPESKPAITDGQAF